VWATIARRWLRRRGSSSPSHSPSGASGFWSRRAYQRALQRAFEAVRVRHGQTLSDYGVDPGFLAHEGAAELAKVIVPGSRPSATILVRAWVDSLHPPPGPAARRYHLTRLEPVFASLLASLTNEAWAERALSGLVGRNGPSPVDAEAGYLRWLVGVAACPSDLSGPRSRRTPLRRRTAVCKASPRPAVTAPDGAAAQPTRCARRVNGSTQKMVPPSAASSSDRSNGPSYRGSVLFRRRMLAW
jgi:hypothetical protein